MPARPVRARCGRRASAQATLNRWAEYFSTEHGCSEGQALCVVVANAAALCAQGLPPAVQVLANGSLRVDLEAMD